MKLRFVIPTISLGLIAGAVLLSLLTTQNASTPQKTVGKCTDGQPAHPKLLRSSSPQLKKLAQYEVLCGGAVVDAMLLFLPMPTNDAEADTYATNAAKSLQEFARQGIAPIVLFEPSLTIPGILSQLASGAHDTSLVNYYQNLKTHGITDAQMGTWVLFPEANTPLWQTTDPETFRSNFIKVATIQKHIFPRSATSILLNSTTYTNNDTNWSSGELLSLKPYLTKLPKRLVDNFGYQGFPNADSGLDPARFLPDDIAQEALHILGIENIWINTGTSQKYSTEQRGLMLNDIVNQALKIKDASVSINIFAEDKSNTAEATDWSYWHGDIPAPNSDAVLIANFIARVRREQLGFSLYDTL